jgi:hypothetical protein
MIDRLGLKRGNGVAETLQLFFVSAKIQQKTGTIQSAVILPIWAELQLD